MASLRYNKVKENIGKEAFCVNSCMSFVVLSSDPSSAMMISEGNIVCLKMLSKQSRKASGQLYVAMINDIVIPFFIFQIFYEE